jgi:hypothetical protein
MLSWFHCPVCSGIHDDYEEVRLCHELHEFEDEIIVRGVYAPYDLMRELV